MVCVVIHADYDLFNHLKINYGSKKYQKPKRCH